MVLLIHDEEGEDQAVDEHQEQVREHARETVRKISAVARLRVRRRLVAPWN